LLSGRGLCDELITRPEESYRPWRVVVCDLETSKNEKTMTRVVSQRHKKKYYSLNIFSVVAIASFTSLLLSLSLFVATNRSRLYTEEIKRCSVTEVCRINNFYAIVGKRWVAETHTRAT